MFLGDNAHLNPINEYLSNSYQKFRYKWHQVFVISSSFFISILMQELVYLPDVSFCLLVTSIFGRQVQCGSILWPGHLDKACDLYFHWGDHQHSHGNYLRFKVWSHLPLLCAKFRNSIIWIGICSIGSFDWGKNFPTDILLQFQVIHKKIKYVDQQKANRFESDFCMSGASWIATLSIDSGPFITLWPQLFEKVFRTQCILVSSVALARSPGCHRSRSQRSDPWAANDLGDGAHHWVFNRWASEICF